MRVTWWHSTIAVPSHALLGLTVALTPTVQAQPAPSPLIGIWKGVDVPAEFVHGRTGAGLALSGWFGQLKLRADGSYEFEEYREGLLANCRVSILQKSRGRAAVQAKDLVLTPVSGIETKRDACSRSNSYSDRAITPRPERWTVDLAWSESLAGWMTLALKVTATSRDREHYTFHAVHDPAAPWPAVRVADLRGARVPAGMPSTWRWPENAAIDFYDAATGRLTPPKGDTHWIRLAPDGAYEWAGWKSDVLPGPGCTRGAFAYERGRWAANLGQYSTTSFLVLRPEQTVTIDRIAGCGSDDGEVRRQRPATPAQYMWSIGRTVNNAEVLEIKCAPEVTARVEWQYLLCHWGFEFRTLMQRVR